MKNNNKEFPNSVFPAEVRDFVEKCSDSQGLCKDFMYSTYLSLASVLIGNSLKININNSWVESPMVWVALVGRSGIKKTPVIKAIIKPLQKIDIESYKKYVESIKNGDTETKPKQSFVDDITIEALYDVLYNNPKGLLLKKDELITLIQDADKYSKGGGTIEKLLSIFSNSPITLNRKTTSQYLCIEHPFLSIIGGIQPKVLPTLFEKNRGDNGFIYRLLFTTIGNYIPKAPENNLNIHVIQGYEEFITKFHTMTSNNESKLIPLSLDALNYFQKWSNEFIYVSTDDDRLNQYKSKLEAYALRFSLIIEMSYSVSASNVIQEISLPSMENAISVVRYFYGNFQDVLSMNSSSTEDKDLKLYKRIVYNYKEGVSKEDTVNELNKEGFTVSSIAKALDIPRSTVSGYVNTRTKTTMTNNE